MTFDTMKAALEAHGFLCGPRDLRLNTLYPGAFMVVDPADYIAHYELPTLNGANGPWCIVGDNFEALVEEAYGLWASEWDAAA